MPAQHPSPHKVGTHRVRRRPHNPHRQRLEPLVVPPLRLGHLVALFSQQRVKGICRGLCPGLRAHRVALLGLEAPLRGLHHVSRVAEHSAEVEVRRGHVGPQGDGLAVGLGCSAPVLLRGVPQALSQQLHVRITRLRSDAGLLLRGLASPHLPAPPHIFVKCPVHLPSARVCRTVLAAEVRRRHLQIAAHVADRVLIPLVVHV
eukprot:scaffold56739_cov66-Phaeocystis_antarctica.AAC.4